MLDFLLVIPTLNEEKYMKEMLDKATKVLGLLFKNYLIVVVDASSTDRTELVVKQAIKANPRLQFIKRKKRGQRGSDVMYGMSRYDAKLYCYVDVDLAPSLVHLKNLIALNKEGYDVVLGSRYIDSGLLHRPPLRLAVSKAYNLMINILFGDKVRDHQIGFRIFDRKAFSLIRRSYREAHWAWDTEVILLAHYNHLKICEVPVRWIERRSERTGIRRLLRDVGIFIPSMARMFYRFRIAGELN